MHKRIFVAMAWLGLAVGCGGGGSSSVDAGGGGTGSAARCDEQSAAICARLFECFTAEERAEIGAPETEAACVTQYRGDLECATVTDATFCSTDETYDPTAHQQCVAGTLSATCEAVRTGEFSAACNEVCVASP